MTSGLQTHTRLWDRRQTPLSLAPERRRTMNEDETKQSTERDSSEPIEPGRERLEKLLRRAEELKLDHDRLLPYAQLFVRAEDHHAGEATSADHTRRARAHIIGQMHDFPGGYDEPEEAIRLEHQAREPRKQFCRLAEAVVHRMRKAEALFDKH